MFKIINISLQITIVQLSNSLKVLPESSIKAQINLFFRNLLLHKLFFYKGGPKKVIITTIITKKYSP